MGRIVKKILKSKRSASNCFFYIYIFKIILRNGTIIAWFSHYHITACHMLLSFSFPFTFPLVTVSYWHKHYSVEERCLFLRKVTQVCYPHDLQENGTDLRERHGLQAVFTVRELKFDSSFVHCAGYKKVQFKNYILKLTHL